MTDRATLQALLNRVLEGEGWDRELDAEIARMIGLRVVEEGHPIGRQCYDKSGLAVDLRRYTTSLDAALTLVPEGLSWHAAMRKCLPPIRATGSVWVDDGQQYALFTADAATPPRALIAACLKARMEALGG